MSLPKSRLVLFWAPDHRHRAQITNTEFDEIFLNLKSLSLAFRPNGKARLNGTYQKNHLPKIATTIKCVRCLPKS